MGCALADPDSFSSSVRIVPRHIYIDLFPASDAFCCGFDDQNVIQIQFRTPPVQTPR